MKKLKRNVKGITMVALVVTIIILLILATVTIGLTIGKNGIFSRAKLAGDEHIKQEATEAMNLKISGIQIQSYTENQKLPDLQYLADRLCEDTEMEYVFLESQKEASLDKIDTSKASSIFTKIQKYPYEFEIDSELKLASIDGVKLADNTSGDILARLDNMEQEIKELQSEKNQLKADLEKANLEITNLKQNNTNIQKSSITACLNAVQTTKATSEKINFNKVYAKVGDAFKLENGEIKVQKDISNIMISVQVYIGDVIKPGHFMTDLYINNKLVNYSISGATDGWCITNVASSLFTAKKGDSIKVNLRSNPEAIGHQIYADSDTASTYITVTEVN